jgi:hypothetical protein
LGCDEAGRLLAFDMERRASAVLSEGPVDILAVSPDTARILVRRTCYCGRSSFDVLERASGTRIAGPFGGGAFFGEWVANRPDGRFLVFHGPGSKAALYDVATGALRTLDEAPIAVAGLDSEHFVFQARDGGLDLTDLAGRKLRRLRF